MIVSSGLGHRYSHNAFSIAAAIAESAAEALSASAAEIMIDDERLKQVKRAAIETLFKIPGVRSVAIGPKYSGGEATGEMAIIVGVDRKRPASEVPPSQMIPTTIDGIKTDVVEEEEEIPVQCTNTLEDDTRYRPLIGGSQIQNFQSSTLLNLGTMGFLAFTTGDIATIAEDLIVGVTCEHVVADAAGKTLLNQKVGQSNMTDCSACSPCCDHIIGNVLFAVDRAPDNSLIDAALIDLTSGLEYFNEVEEIGAVSGFHAILPSDLKTTPPHYPVKKRGRTTGLTTGDVLKVDGTSVINGTTFTHSVIKIQPDPATSTWCKCGTVQNLRAFACEGDSGSALLNTDDEVVGLVRSRDNNGNGFARSIDLVMKALGILVGTASEEGDKRVVPPHPQAMPSALPAVHSSSVLSRQREVLERAQREIMATATGKRYAELVTKNQTEVRQLIERNKRVATVWHRNNGPAILNCAMRALDDTSRTLPIIVNGAPVADSIGRIIAFVKKHGSPQLRADIDQFNLPFSELPGLTYPQWLDRLRRAHLE